MGVVARRNWLDHARRDLRTSGTGLPQTDSHVLKHATSKHVRRRNVDLERVWDVESATGKGVLYVTRSKNEMSKRPIPLNQAAKEAVERMLRRADTLGH